MGFCSKCGKDIEDGANLCPACEQPMNAMSNAEVVSEKSSSSYQKEVFVKGVHRLSPTKYERFHGLTTLGIWGFAWIINLMTSDGFWGLYWLVPIFYIGAYFVFKESILFDEKAQTFIYNEHARLDFLRVVFNVSDITKIRLRYVKYRLGKYYVISFELKSMDPVRVWFLKKDNRDEFIPAIEYAVHQNGDLITVERNDTLMTMDEFLNENNRAEK